MKSHRRIVLPLLVGIMLVAFALSIAQTSSQQANQKKQVESYCAMDSCCCHGDSCAIKTGEGTDAAKSTCCGDSCDMKTGEGTDAAKTDCCAGGSCNMKMKHDAKNHAKTARGDMKKHDMKNHDMKKHDMKDGCCCCADSCDTKVKQTAG